MSLVRNIWGGEFDASPPTREYHRDYDKKAAEYRSASNRDQVMEESWLLRPRKEKKKKSIDITLVLRTMVLVACLVGIVLAVLAVTRWRHKVPVIVPDNYTVALHHALTFFNAQKSGGLPQQNNVSWRGNSGLKDEIIGGYYDGGDTIKYSFPASFAMTMLSWSVIEYSPNYDEAGELDHVKDIIRWGTDYLLKTFNSSGDSIGSVVAQLGGDRDLYCWMRPEDMDDDDEQGNPRRALHCSNCPALAAEMAAALAAASIVFRYDYGYSEKLVHGASVLFKFATNGQGENYAAGGPDPPYYNSSGYWDEFVWGGTWLYLATGNLSYLELVTSPKMANKSIGFQVGPDHGVNFSWDNKQAGALLLLTRVRIFLGYGYPYEEMLSKYHRNIEDIMCSYLPFSSSFTRTKGGLILLNHGKPRPLQYVVNAAFLASLFSDYLNAKLIPGWQCRSQFYSTQVLRDFATTQIDYILGNNPQNLSYIVGFGDNFPRQVHHRGASIPYNKVKYGCKQGWEWRDSKHPNPNVIVGAMVAGPNKNDGFFDLRFNANYTEPTIAGNAGLVAALVALSGGETSNIDKNTIFHGITRTL